MKSRADESHQESQIIGLIFLGMLLPSLGLVMGDCVVPTIMWLILSSFVREGGSPLIGIVIVAVFGTIGLLAGAALFMIFFIRWMAE